MMADFGKTMELLLIRHGQAEPIKGAEAPELDYPLTERGREQARLLAERLAGAPPDLLYASPILRARQTAEIVADRLGQDIIFEPGLREIETGLFGPTPADERQRRFPQLYGADGTLSVLDFSALQGEGGKEFGKRVASAIQEIIIDRHAHGDERVAAVAHGGFINAALAFFLGMTFTGRGVRFETENTSIATIKLSPGFTRVVRVNEIGHLDSLPPASAAERHPTER